jgi:hypothetical protein
VGWNNCIICQDDGDDEDEAQPRRVFQLSMDGHHLVWHRMCRARDPLYKRRLHPGIWYHAVAVYEAGTHRLYLDGEQCDEVAHPLTVHREQPMHIGRKGTAEPYFFFRGAIDDVRIYDRALSPQEVRDEFAAGGFSKPPIARAITADALSGRWGERGVVFLDLRAEPGGSISGMIMSGRPDNMWPIVSGRFDRDTGSIHLEGIAKHPESELMAPYAIDGLLDGDEITVSAAFHDYRGNHTFTQKGAITAV